MTAKVRGLRAMAMAAAVGSAACGAGCSVIVIADDTQCQTDDDCAELGFDGYTCGEAKICIDAGCDTNDECIEANNGAPSICRASDKKCVQLTTEDCIEVLGDPKDEDAVVVGFLGPLTGDFESIGRPIKQAASLGFVELDQNANGLPGVNGGPRRSILFVACHDLGGPEEDPWRAAEHLINDVQVPAIIGPAFSGVTIATASDVAVPGKTLLLSASATSPSISKLQDDDLVWRTCPSDALQAIPIAGLVEPLETEIRADPDYMLTPDDPIRVAMTVKGDAYGKGLAEAVTPLLQFNGKNVAGNGANFLRVDYPDPSTDPNVNYGAVVQQVVEFQPHIVLVFGTNEGITKVFQAIEDTWVGGARPHYVFPDGGRLDELRAAVMGDEDLRLRVRGTIPGTQGPLKDAFRIRYKAEFGSEPEAYTDTGYDASYVLMYALAGLGAKPVTGPNLADSLKKLSAGETIDAGPTSISDGFSTLSADGEMDYVGVSGPLNFDPATGEAKADIDVWCVGSDNEFKVAGQHYDAAQEKLVGTFMCP